MPDTQRSLNTLLDHAGRSLSALCHRYATGQFTADIFGDHMLGTLESAHTQAVVLGRHRAGDTTPLEEDDREFARHVLREEEEFLSAFLDDLEEGRYNDDLGHPQGDAIERRARLYLGRVSGTANEAWALTADGPFRWLLGDAAHCGDCPELAAASPYTIDSLPAYPRDNSTSCLQSCKCLLVDAQGRACFEG